jgi:DNA-binding NtrC family response regulator
VANQDTADPIPESLQARADSSRQMVFLEIAFHSDLGRIGERFELGAPGTLGSAGLLLGREEPQFTMERGGRARSLQDPCLSRRQARILWQHEQGRFQVEATPEARRPLRLFHADGQEMGVAPGLVPPGGYLAIGDRVLLRLDVGPDEPDEMFQMRGRSPAMALLRRRVQAVAEFSDPVLIQGETGTGKELVARALHLASRRRGNPFVALNCAALPEALLESELFGHSKGAFSGAVQAKRGLFATATGGTLFLDEIGELPQSTQAKLLRVLETRRVRPLGAQQEESLDVRVVAATHRDLREDVESGAFRADLFGRIESPQVLVPPLRERPCDLPLLFATLMERRAAEHARTLGLAREHTPLGLLWQGATIHAPPIPMGHFLWMLGHDWPRNVRELDKFAAELAVALVQGTTLPLWPTREPLSLARPPLAVPRSTRRDPAPRGEIERALEEHQFNQTRAARGLGVPYATLDRWMRELGIVRPRDIGHEQLREALRRNGGDLEQTSRELKLSVRGLQGRMKELGFKELPPFLGGTRLLGKPSLPRIDSNHP